MNLVTSNVSFCTLKKTTMIKKLLPIILKCLILVFSLTELKAQTKLDYKFIVSGCNRVDPADTLGNPSTANVYQLNRMFQEVSQMNPLPKYLFFAGDMVLGYEKDTLKLEKQLTNWLSLYKASPLFNTSVQLVAIQGNHETQDKAAGKVSFVAAERTFIRVMGKYIIGSNGPVATGLIAGTDSLITDQSKLTYSFDFNNDHFVIVNTDPVGRDGKASYKWIANDIKNARLKGARHIFGIGHKPAYTGHFKTTADGLENNLVQRDSFWTNMEKYQADAYFSAHIHASDSIQPHSSKTWQIIAGNGGSLVEPLFASAPNAYFGYVVVNVWSNDSVDVKNMGRDAVMTAASYTAATPSNPTTLRTSYNINVNPTINHTQYSNSTSVGPFTLIATIKDNIAVTSAQLNYNVNGVVRTAIIPTISGNTYTFLIPAQTSYGVISYNIQANDISGFKIYSLGASNKYSNFSYGPLTQTGPNSSRSPYLEPIAPGVKTTAIMSAGDSIGNYKMAGIPDGLGAFDNGNGTFTLLMNHEITNTSGVARAHGSKGAFVSKWIINKSDLSVVSGSDLMKNVNLWDTTSKSYKTYNAANPSPLTVFGRFCAADLPLQSAFYNSVTGLGTQERIYMNGEETNDESRAFAHIVTGTNAGTSYELPAFGKGAWENAIACPNSGDKTVVGLTNDGTDGQVYFYIGTKTNTGSEIEKAGLSNGKPWGVKVTGFAAERTSTTSNIALPAAGTRFSLVDLGVVTNMSGTAFNTSSNTAGVTKFSRPEDGAWDPSSPKDFYFNTTDQIDQVMDGVGTLIGRSRVWRLRFDDVTKPELGGTIEAVLDGTEGQVMLDNMVIDKYSHIILQEDVGNSAHNGKIWEYNIKTDKITKIAKHDASRFGDLGVAAVAPYNQDEESSGIIDMQDILGAGMYLTSDQAHYSIPGEIYEGGQLLSVFIPETKNSFLGAGPSSGQSPYLFTSKASAKFTSILTTGDAVGNYKMAGIPDGLGAFDNGNGTFTVLMNHEIPNTSGVARAHGSIGGFVSKWVINKNDLSVVSGGDLIKNVNLWSGGKYTTYNSANPSPLAAFNRFCSADLAPVSAFYNNTTGLGTQERIFLNGEEGGTEARAFGHIATGSNAGNTYELPAMGKFSWENSVASPTSSNKTVVIGMDDATPGQVYVYIGTKTSTGTEIDKAGLTNGKLYGVAVSGLTTEVSTGIPADNTGFSLADLGYVKDSTGAALEKMSTASGVTKFLRPEDGAWDPSNLRDFYFVTTNAFTAPSRLWRLRFNDASKPELGGTITAVLDGTEGQKMLDNIAIDNFGHILMQEDVGANAHIGKIWQYTMSTDAIIQVGYHDSSRFITGASDFLTIDEESSGIIDVQSILGPGMFLCDVQAHYSIPGELYEGGQLLAFYNPDTKLANPKITVVGNNVNIAKGDASPIYIDNTDFGSVEKGKSKLQNFEIKNAGPGTLKVNAIRFTGENELEFSLISPSSFPINIPVNASQTISVQFEPKSLGGKVASIMILNNDFDLPEFDYVLQGFGVVNTSIANIDGKKNKLMVYPNPNNTGTLNFSTTISLEIFDYTGKLIKTGAMVNEINVSDMVKGIYLLKTSDGETKKFIIQ